MSTPLPARLVAFYGDEVIAIQDEDGTIFAVFARLCDNLGLGRESQVRRIRRHAVLNEGLVTRTVTTAGGTQAVQCLRADLLPLWLAGVQADRVKDEDTRAKLVRYQREAAQVLWQAFRHQILTEESSLAPESAQAVADLERIVEQSKAMLRMAEGLCQNSVVRSLVMGVERVLSIIRQGLGSHHHGLQGRCPCEELLPPFRQ